MADFRKSGNFGGGVEFLQAHVSKSPVADFQKLQTWGGACAEHNVTKTLFMIQATKLLNVSMIPIALNEVVLVTYL